MSRQQVAITLHAVPSVAFLAFVGIFVGRDAGFQFNPPLLLPILSSIFLAALPLVIALLALRSYVEQGPRVLLLFGCGLVVPAVGSLLATWGLLANGTNYLVTVLNFGVMVGGGCHLAAALMVVLSAPYRRRFPRSVATLIGVGAYAAAAALMIAVALLAAGGRTPPFFISHAGPTFLRQVVLSLAATSYMLGAALLISLYAQTGMTFFGFYANALFLTAAGLAALLVFTTGAGPLSWIGRAAQYAGSIYFVATLFVHSGPPRRQGTSLPGYLSELLRSHLDQEVRHRTVSLMMLNERLRKEMARRQLLDEELRASEERLRLAASATGFGVFSFDFSSRRAYYSPEMLALLGLPAGADPVLSEEAWIPEAVHPDDRARLAELGAEWIRPGGSGVIDAEYRVVLPDGTLRWLRAHGRIGVSGGGGADGPRQAHGIVQEITERKLAEEKLQEREETYRLLLENSIQGIAIVQDGRIVLCNEALCALSGYSKEETLGASQEQVMATVHELDRPRLTAALHTLLDSGEAPPGEIVRLVSRSGGVRWVEMRGGMTLFRGRPAVQVSYLDVTDQRRAEEAYRTLVENTAEGYSLIVEGKVEFANASLAQMLGCSTLALRQMSAEDLVTMFHPDDRSRISEAFSRPSSGEYQTEQAYRIRRRDGAWRILEVRSARVEHAGAQAAQTSYRDVTEVLVARQALEDTHRKVRNLASHLLRAREEERRKVAQEVHDDLGQALAALKMDAYWLRQHLGEPAGTGQHPPAVAGKLDEMIELCEETIASVHRIASDLRPKMLDDLGLAPSLQWLAGEFHRRTGLHCDLSVSLPPGKIGQDAATSLYRVVQEALNNVARHSLARSAAVSLATEAEAVVLSVQDDGIGISPARASAPNSFGLIGVRERIESLGGNLLVVGEPGKGTTLTAWVPLPALRGPA